MGVPLVTVDELVREHSGDLGGEAGCRGSRDVRVDVGEGEVDLFVVGVEVGLLYLELSFSLLLKGNFKITKEANRWRR